ncbi:MAG TPA: pyridoxal 5'-phosphate synthase glutaminase subunit PdxT [Spirochaetia bacterium]|nr:pyridoxal 5'-phosphate synthase glutaminase subunit PdxT [Spirochaetia bacterium]
MSTVGILGLQGDFEKHFKVVERIGATPRIVVSPKEIEGIDSLIIPGGESTTMGKLMVNFRLLEPLRERVRSGMPVFGTCAGMILLATDILGSDQPRIGLLDVEVSRNAYGRQIESFEADVPVSFIPEPVRGVFIRAPKITRLGSGVETLGRFEEAPVLIRQKNILACSFHPELTQETRIHEYFLSMD